MKILLSAYACEPNRGSEPGVGWNTAREMSKYHDIWVITRANNRQVIEAELTRNPVPNLHFVYYDLPNWTSWWKRGERGIQLYYYLWQIGIYSLASRLHKEIGFDLTHHITFGRYWSPSFVSLLPAPFLFGPVGGGESAPKAFWHDFGWRGFTFEVSRETVRKLAEFDPFVRLTIRHSKVVLAKAPETANRLLELGTNQVTLFGESAMSSIEIEQLSKLETKKGSFRFISIGNLLHLKGFHLGLRAFAQAKLSDAEYWTIGSGPEEERLKALASSLGIANRVRFCGKLPRSEAIAKLSKCDVLVHPSLHDSGGWVCLEAMAAGKPVLCLDLGGPAVQVTEETGFKVPALNPEQVLRDLGEAMQCVANDPELCFRKGQAGRERVLRHFEWSKKAQALNALYLQVVDEKLDL